MQFTKVFLAGSALVATASAWNTDVHNQIGFMAEKFLTPATEALVQKILEPQYNGSIGKAAAWADGYRRLPEGAYTYQWHWIDSLDTPPAVCNTYYNRDCTKGGCIVSAIANQSSILRECVAAANHGSLSGGKNITCSNALKFVTHFISDLAQPLHTSNLGAGGNAFNVTYGNKTSVLHSIWDGAIIYSLAKKSSFSNQTIDPFFNALTTRIKSDNFFTPTAKWIACADPATPVQCAMEWASDANQWNCDYVYSQNYSAPDLIKSGYFEGAYPIVEIQMSKAAFRLGTYLNNLFSGRYDADRQVILRVNPAWKEEL